MANGTQVFFRKVSQVAGIVGLVLILNSCGTGGAGNSTVSGGSNGSGPSGPPPLPPSPNFPNNRAQFVRTDDTPLGVVYDPIHRLIFATNFHLSRVVVISPATAQIVATIPVPAPVGLSLSADNTRVLVGSYTQQVTWIDTASLQVVERDTLPQLSAGDAQFFGQTWVQEGEPFQAANGKILLFANWGYGDLQGNYLTGSDQVAEWDPSAGTVKLRPDSGGGGIVSASADHSKILVGGTGQATLYDSASDTFTPIQGFQSGVYVPAINPTGTQFALINGAPLFNFFSATGNLIGSLDFPLYPFLSNFGGRPSSAVYSPDGKYLYVVLPNILPLLVTVDATTFKVVGTAPAYYSDRPYIQYQLAGVAMAADDTGLVFEIADHGVAIDDATNTHNFASSLGALQSAIIATPSEGPVNTSTVTNITTQAFDSLPAAYFGNQLARGVGFQSNGNQLQLDSPPSSVIGPVNLKFIMSDGRMAMMPQSFTYGVVPVQYGDIAASPQGGVPADLFGLGFGADISSSSTQVRIGQSSAPLASSQGSGLSYPFPLQGVSVVVPAGTPGTTQDITISSPSGTSRIARAFHYLAGVTDYPSIDSFQFALYDSHRNQVYLSAGDHVDVFLPAAHSFGPPIAVPSLGGTRQLTGLALTPDGSKFLVGNASDGSVAILDPDNPATGAIAVHVPPPGTQYSPGPFEIVATGTNKAFIITSETSVTGGSGVVYELDLTTLALKQRNDIPFIVEISRDYLCSSADGNTVVLAVPNDSAGPAYVWKASTDSWQFHLLGYEQFQFIGGAAISGDGNVVAVSFDISVSDYPFPFLMDSQLNIMAELNFPDFNSPENGPPMLLDQSGALLYAMTPLGIFITDTHHDQLRENVLLSEPLLPFAIQPMAITPSGDQIFLLTSTGLTVVQLDAVPLSIGSATPNSGASGTKITLRGSGFVSGTTVALRGKTVASNFIDPSTISFTVPSLPKLGPVQITVQNPDGSAYSLDAGFLVH